MVNEIELMNNLSIIIPLITGIIGAIIGSLITVWNERHKEKKQVKAVRTLIKTEIKTNLNYMHEICDKIKEKTSSKEEYKIKNLKYLRKIEWKRNVWGSKTTLFALALSEDEIYRIEEFYSLLEKISLIQTFISSIKSVGLPKEIKNSGLDTVILDWMCVDIYKEKWDEFTDTSNIVLEKGNLLVTKLS